MLRPGVTSGVAMQSDFAAARELLECAQNRAVRERPNKPRRPREARRDDRRIGGSGISEETVDSPALSAGSAAAYPLTGAKAGRRPRLPLVLAGPAPTMCRLAVSPRESPTCRMMLGATNTAMSCPDFAAVVKPLHPKRQRRIDQHQPRRRHPGRGW